MSSAITYLTPKVRLRANLAILANTTVRRVTFSGKRVSGVEIDGPEPRMVRGANVISCAGAIQSPILLQRSGIGPADMLSAAGIDVVADRKGVGRNLQNHPFLDITTHLHRRARARNALYPPSMVTARFASECPGAPPADLVLNLFERVSLTLARDPLARHFANFMLLLNKAYSEGTVAIDPAKPFGDIKVKTNILGDVRDRDRMIAGFRRVALLTQSAHFKGLVSEAFVLKPHWTMMALMQGTWRSQIVSDLGALALESPGVIRRFILRNAVAPIETLLNNATALENHVMSNTQIGGHPAGTCRLGDAARDTTVVDSRCRVVGVDGLRVVDASIFPTLMRAGPNLPVMTAAEKAATMIQEDARGA
jgi:5-(hydroxymethyl)furfural/furfural oxidase